MILETVPAPPEWPIEPQFNYLLSWLSAFARLYHSAVHVAYSLAQGKSIIRLIELNKIKTLCSVDTLILDIKSAYVDSPPVTLRTAK